jgi:hypothetical protein
MRRFLLVPLLTLATLGALALPAHAKGPAEDASGQVVITGPGLQGPIELEGTVHGFAEPGDGFIPTGSGTGSREEMDFTAFLYESGLLSFDEGDHGGWFVLRPEDLHAIGPAYQLRFDLVGQGWSQTLTRQLYPFAPERPLIFTPSESITVASRSRMQNLRGLWWSAPPALLAILHDRGLPLTPPVAVEPPPAPAPVPPPEHPRSGVFPWAAIALLGLLVASILAGRRRMRVA